MISCFFHSHAIHRHLDDGEPLPESTTGHIENCARCRQTVNGQSAVIEALIAPVERTEAPPFLHARIIRALREPQNKPRRNLKTQWAVATCAIAVITIGLAVFPPERSVEPAPSWPALRTELTLKTPLPENPLESEINHLREDTLNAAKAFAANFVPDLESKN
jgi:hypothetical protein